MVRYDIKIPYDAHWEAMWEEIERLHSPIKHPFDIDSFLRKYNGKIYQDPGYLDLRIIKGIEFKSEEDLMLFKLRF